MNKVLAALVFAAGLHSNAVAQHRCTENGKVVFRETPCSAKSDQPAYRCFVDGVVVFTETPCPKIKTKAQIAAEEASKREEALIAKIEKAKALQEADKKNAPMRKIQAETVVQKHMRDPESARFGVAYVSWLSGSPAVCGVVSGKNGFGGYAQPTGYVVVGTTAIIEDRLSPSLFVTFFKDYCAP